MAWWAGLTQRQRKYCEEYASNGGNSFAAAKAAGYGKPQVEGHRNSQNARIIGALNRLRQDSVDSSIATRQERQTFWSSMMRDPNVSEKDRLRASELLGKCHADFVERREVSGPGGAPLSIELRDLTDDQLRAIEILARIVPVD